jgi:cytochrome c oxidase subunit II
MFRQKGIVIALSALMALLIVLSVFAIRLYLSRTKYADRNNGKTGQIEPTGEVVDGVRIVKMKARQHEFEPNQVVVKTGEKVRLEITSEDVTHGIEIEGFDINRELPPNETVNVDFTAKDTRTYNFDCSILCGPGHNEMKGKLIVLPGGK